MGLGIPPLRIKIMLESNSLKSTMSVGRLGIVLVKVRNNSFYIGKNHEQTCFRVITTLQLKRLLKLSDVCTCFGDFWGERIGGLLGLLDGAGLLDAGVVAELLVGRELDLVLLLLLL